MKTAFSKVIAVMLALAMLVCSVPAMSVAVSAAAPAFGNAQLAVISDKTSTLATGVTLDDVTAYDKNGDQVKMLITTVDPTVESVRMYTTYKDMDPTNYGMSKLTEQVAAFNKKVAAGDGYYEGIAVAGINASYYNTNNGKPTGVFVMNGVDVTNEAEGKSYGYFAVMKDGTYKIGNIGDYSKDKGNIQEAFGIYTMLIVNGVMRTGLGDVKYPRQTVGITADGKVILMTSDGNQAPTTCGLTVQEQAQVMLDLGCVWAGHLDGGGSATYGCKPEGEDNFVITSSPSDGSPRSIANGFIIASTEVASYEFDHVVYDYENEYMMPGASINVEINGASSTGHAAEIPEGVVYETVNGTYENGVFTAGSEVGTASITAMYNGKAIGTTAFNVVIPDAVSFDQRSLIVPFGESIKLAVTANYGINEVVYRWADVTFTLADNTIGTIENGVFTAAESGTETQITVSVNANAAASDTITLKLGKGSEVAFDFEAGTASADLNNWVVKDHEGKYPVYAKASIVNRETGMVHGGEQALAFNMANETRVHGSEGYNAQSITWVGDRVTLKNAISIGFWVYIPREATNTEIALNYIYYDASGAQKRVTPDACMNNTFNNMEYSGWHYLSVPVSQELAYIEDGAAVAAAEGYKRNFFLKFYVTNKDAIGESSHMGNITYYIDDVTIDYSSAVADREAPIFSDVKYAHEGMADAAILNGQTVSTGKLSFTALVKEDTTKDNYTGLNAATAKAYIDGVEVECGYVNGIISIADAVLENGTHTVTFEVCDNTGNYSKISKQIVVAADDSAPAVDVVPRDASLDRIATGSVYWLDVVAKDVEKVKTIELKLDLDTMNDWELEHITKLYGFEVKTEYVGVNDEAENVATITLTRTGDVEATGTQVIMSIPIRVWAFTTDDTGKAVAPATAWAAGGVPAVAVIVTTEKGVVTYLDDSTASFSAEDLHVDTEAYACYLHLISTTEGNAYWKSHTYHVHAAVALDDKAATCTEAGYTGRTYCEGCSSVVEWGTTSEATGHSYDFVEGVLACECGKTFTGVWTDGKTYVDGVIAADGWAANDKYYVGGVALTGIQLIDGYYYDFGENGVCAGQTKYTGLLYDEAVSAWRYSLFGELAGGWRQINGNWHYFKYWNKLAATGEHTVNGVTFQFNEQGMTKGTWVEDEIGLRYWYGPEYYRGSGNDWYQAFQEIDGKTYNFDAKGYVTFGKYYALRPGSFIMMKEIFEFNEDGSLKGKVTEQGIYDCGDGEKYYVNEDGIVVMDGGLFFYNDNYYFTVYSGKLAVNQTRTVTEEKTNGLLDAGNYYFNGEGKMEMPFTGLKDVDGVTYYYVNGAIAQDAGLVKIGEDYYYVVYSGKIAKDQTRTVTEEKTNGLLDAGNYYFIAEGKMEMPFTGLKDVDGVTYYYVNGAIAKDAGLVKIGEDYYYVVYSGKIAKDQTRSITAEKANGFIEAGNYFFNAEGKMVKN